MITFKRAIQDLEQGLKKLQYLVVFLFLLCLFVCLLGLEHLECLSPESLSRKGIDWLITL